MLVSFSIENWMSFRDRSTLSMTATREIQHKERVPLIPKYPVRILPIASIYGGNASGKTNLFQALNFVKNLVISGTQPDGYIPINTFKLENEKQEELPAKFEIEILIKDIIYEFSFSVNRKSVLEEKLVKISRSSEQILYHRLNGEFDLDSKIETDELKFAFKGTRKNQLFITNSVSQNIDTFRPIYDWFKNTLELIAPDSRFEPFEQFFDEKHPLYSIMNTKLAELDTGIDSLGSEDIAFENTPLPEPIKMKLKQELPEGFSIRFQSPNNDRFIITRNKNGELVSKKLVAYHKRNDGKKIKFEIRQESDGSQRIIDLLPAFLELDKKITEKVFLIDEIDRSLHPLLIKALIEEYLLNCSETTRSQLLFTTHNVLLMDQDIFRRDEIWISERSSSGASKLISFSEYKDVRSDKDILKSYLQGRLGGIPNILINQ